MSKGFVFSIDAALALIAVGAVAVLVLAANQGIEGQAEKFNINMENARDTAAVKMYNNAAPIAPNTVTNDPAAEGQGVCRKVYSYGTIAADSGQPGLEIAEYCSWWEA